MPPMFDRLCFALVLWFGDDSPQGLSIRLVLVVTYEYNTKTVFYKLSIL